MIVFRQKRIEIKIYRIRGQDNYRVEGIDYDRKEEGTVDFDDRETAAAFFVLVKNKLIDQQCLAEAGVL